MIKLLKYMKKSGVALAAACLVLVAGQVWLDLTLPDYMRDISQLIITPGSNIADVWKAGGKMLLCALGSAALSVIVGYFAARIAADFSFSVREKLFGQVSDFGAAEIKKFSTASLITRTTNDITQITMFVALGLQVMIKAPIMAVWAIVKIVGKSWQLSLTTAAAVAVISAVIAVLAATVIPKFKIVQSQIDSVNRITRENLTGLRVVHAFNAEPYQESKFEDASVRLMKTQLFTARGLAVMQPVMMLVMSGLSLAIYWLGASLINQIQLTSMSAMVDRINLMSNVVVFSSYAIYVIMAFIMLVVIFMILPRAQVSAERINQVLDANVAVKDGPGASSSETGTVEFRNVSFRYPDAAEDCLKNISFRAAPGETVAFIGATGSGKTTLLNLAARLYDATSGEVLVDGVNVKDYTYGSLYDRLGFVPQRAVMFSGTVQENVAFGDSGRTALLENVGTAADIAQASEFVEEMAEKYDTDVAQGGTNLSGGQKQRLSIARAIARKPEILILDDAFSALDFRTDRELRKRIDTDLKGITCLIVSQRIGTILHANRIVVLDGGEAVGIGTHEELMKTCSVYREIALSQLSASELDA